MNVFGVVELETCNPTLLESWNKDTDPSAVFPSPLTSPCAAAPCTLLLLFPVCSTVLLSEVVDLRLWWHLGRFLPIALSWRSRSFFRRFLNHSWTCNGDQAFVEYMNNCFMWKCALSMSIPVILAILSFSGCPSFLKFFDIIRLTYATWEIEWETPVWDEGCVYMYMYTTRIHTYTCIYVYTLLKLL